MNKFFIKDSNGKPSVTVTAFIVGFLVVNLKLILSGITVSGIALSAFTGSEYGISIGALGAIYVLRRATDKGNDSKEE